MDLEAKKAALRSLETGLYLVGCADGDKKNVFLASWIVQASFEPPLVTLGLKKGTLSHELISSSKGFVVNIPSSEQKDLVQKFFKHGDCEDGVVHGEEYTTSGKYGAPVLKGTPAWFEADVLQTFTEGDHDVVVAKVIDAGLNTKEKFAPLTESATGWNYGG